MADGGIRTIGVTVAPLDTLFFRDGRPFEAGSQVASGLPMPQTIAGALRTWLLAEVGCNFRGLADAVRAGVSFRKAAAAQGESIGAIADLTFRGPWFAKEGEVCVPVPASLRRDEGTGAIARLDPLIDPPDWWQTVGNGMRPLWRRDPGHHTRLDGYVTLTGLERFLTGSVPDRERLVAEDSLLGFDRRTGIGIEAETSTAREGLIYAVSLLALRQGVTLYGEIIGPSPVVDAMPTRAVVALGGEGRRAVVTLTDPVAWPGGPATVADADRRLVVLTTPGLFDGGWKPAALKPVAAAVPGYVAVSGWDLARGGPKPNCFAAAAGSVFFFDRPITPPTIEGSLCAGEDAALGWGCYVEGAWNHA